MKKKWHNIFYQVRKMYWRIIVFIVIITTTCCTPSSNPQVEILSLDDTTNWKSEITDLNLFLLPPAELMAFITDVELKSNLTNSPNNKAFYTNTRSKSINLGIYMSDIIYLGINNENIKIPQYLNEINQLSNDLKIKNIFSDEFAMQISENIHNKDSIFKISRLMQESFLSAMEADNRENILTMVSMGIFIESLYLTLENIDTYNSFNEISIEILNQKLIFEQYYDYAQHFVNDPNVLEVMKEIQPLKEFFNKLEVTHTKKTIEKDSANHFIVKGGSILTLNEKDFKSLKIVVKEIREQLVKFK